MRSLVAALLIAIAAAVGAQTSPVAPAPAAQITLSGAALAAALRRGGYVIYFRHASTDFGQDDTRMTGYEDCATQRNLTEVGRSEARAIGVEVKRLKIPVARVLASPYCRTIETGRLIFGTAEVSMAARGGPASADGDRYAELKALFATPPPQGSNVVISSHGNPYRAIVSGAYLQEGEAAIIEPLPPNNFRVVARITKNDWAALPAP